VFGTRTAHTAPVSPTKSCVAVDIAVSNDMACSKVPLATRTCDDSRSVTSRAMNLSGYPGLVVGSHCSASAKAYNAVPLTDDEKNETRAGAMAEDSASTAHSEARAMLD
jgi:hypothetical protein